MAGLRCATTCLTAGGPVYVGGANITGTDAADIAKSGKLCNDKPERNAAEKVAKKSGIKKMHTVSLIFVF